MASKVYGVVLSNNSSGLFYSWPDAQDFIKTCPSNAKYKGFNTEEKAKEFVDEILGVSMSRDIEADGLPEIKAEPGACIAYVDGSFNAKNGLWGYGVVLFKTETPDIKSEFNGSGSKYAESRNVTGEVYGAMIAVRQARRLDMKKITIYHDYAGIADWVTGAWKTNTEMTQKYAAWMTAQKKHIEIEFVKVEGHTGVELNERCDALAKTACGIIG